MEKKVYPVNVVVFHQNAHRHIDDAACLWVARTRSEAEHWFPGISKTEIVFDGMGGETYEGKSGDELLVEERILLFGVGGGIFDAHPGPNNPGKDGCELSLFCNWIGISDDPALAKILEYVAESDRGNSGHFMSIGSVAKILDYATDPMNVFGWQITALDALYKKQAEFVGAQFEYEQSGVKEKVGKWNLVVIESENPHMKEVAFFNGAAILIQKRPLTAEVLPCRVTIFTHRRARVDLSEVVALLRQEEQRVHGRPVATDHRKLRAPGKMEGVPEWYYMVGDAGQACLNGSFSAPDVPATKLTLSTIKEIVIASVR